MEGDPGRRAKATPWALWISCGAAEVAPRREMAGCSSARHVPRCLERDASARAYSPRTRASAGTGSRGAFASARPHRDPSRDREAGGECAHLRGRGRRRPSCGERPRLTAAGAYIPTLVRAQPGPPGRCSHVRGRCEWPRLGKGVSSGLARRRTRDFCDQRAVRQRRSFRAASPRGAVMAVRIGPQGDATCD